MPADDVIMPDDYQDLLAEYGPGTVCGTLRLLAPGGPDGFRFGAGPESLFALGVEQGHWSVEAFGDEDATAIASAPLWGVFDSGETCCWLPIKGDPADWLVLIVGHGWQQLNISTSDFLVRWAEGRLDLPVLSHGAVRREWRFTPAGEPVTVPDEPDAGRDPLAQLATIVGPGHASPVGYDWDAIETELGSPVPPDYKRLHEAYGIARPKGHFRAWNGIFTSSPTRAKEIHDEYQSSVRDYWELWRPAEGSPLLDEVLFCGSTEGRDLLAWDTREPDPSRWPVICASLGVSTVFPGTLTELYVAELTGTGPGLASFGPGNPATWAWPFWGPDAPRRRHRYR